MEKFKVMAEKAEELNKVSVFFRWGWRIAVVAFFAGVYGITHVIKVETMDAKGLPGQKVLDTSQKYLGE